MSFFLFLFFFFFGRPLFSRLFSLYERDIPMKGSKTLMNLFPFQHHPHLSRRSRTSLSPRLLRQHLPIHAPLRRPDRRNRQLGHERTHRPMGLPTHHPPPIHHPPHNDNRRFHSPRIPPVANFPKPQPRSPRGPPIPPPRPLPPAHRKRSLPNLPKRLPPKIPPSNFLLHRMFPRPQLTPHPHRTRRASSATHARKFLHDNIQHRPLPNHRHRKRIPNVNLFIHCHVIRRRFRFHHRG